MKMKKVYSQMTKTPYMTLLNNAYLNKYGELITGEQWLSNGKAAYMLEGLPQFGTDNVLNLLAVPEKTGANIPWLKELSDLKAEKLNLSTVIPTMRT